jgi:hypothetical protein
MQDDFAKMAGSTFKLAILGVVADVVLGSLALWYTLAHVLTPYLSQQGTSFTAPYLLCLSAYTSIRISLRIPIFAVCTLAATITFLLTHVVNGL